MKFDSNMSISLRQLAFIEAYATTGRARESAVTAGYADKSAHVSASRLLRSKRVQEALLARGADARAKFDVTREGLVAELLRAVDLARERGDPMAMVAAARELGRLCGFYGTPAADQ